MLRSNRKSPSRRFTAGIAAAAASAMVLAGCAGAPAEAPTPDEDEVVELQPVRVALPALSGFHWDVHVAAAQGFFEANGIEYQEILVAGPAPAIDALASNSADVGFSFADNVLTATALGAGIRYIAGQNNYLSGTLVGNLDITDVSQLEGTQIASSSPIDNLTVAVLDELAEQGVDTDTIDIAIVGSSQQRFQALQGGGLGAAVLTAPIDSDASAAGYPILFKIRTEGLASAHSASLNFIEEKPDLAIAYTRSIIQAVEWLNDPANREEAIQILIDKTNVSQEGGEASYELFVVGGSFREGAPLADELVLGAVRALEAVGALTDPSLDPDDYIARHILDAALESLN